MNFYFCFCLGLLVGSVFSLLYIRKQLNDEFETKYGNDIETYKKIVDDFNIQVDCLEEERKALLERLSAYENTD